jgi:hypothetical protein
MRRKQRDRQIYEKSRRERDRKMVRHEEGKTDKKRDREMVRLEGNRETGRYKQKQRRGTERL